MKSGKLRKLEAMDCPKPIAYGKKYALFVPLVEEEGELSLLYQQRSATLRRQPNEICFPGGKIDQGESVRTAALRELQEELGIAPVAVYGETDFLQLRNGDLVFPVLGMVAPPYVLNPAEVARVFSVPVASLKSQQEEYQLQLDPQALFPKELLKIPEDYQFSSATETFPVYRWQEDIIWGMTARITKRILDYL